MPYTSPAAPVSGAVISKTTFGDVVKADLDYLANPPACRVYHNVNQAIATGTLVTLLFNSKRFDTDTMHSTSSLTERITVKTAGIYVVTAHVSMTGSTAGSYRQTTIYINSTFIGRVTTPPESQPTNHVVTATWKAAVNDVFTVVCDHDAGAGINAVSNTSWSPEFSAVWVGLG